MTKDPIHILNSVLEDAREYKKEVWVLLQDMRRCFDSVSCQRGGMLELGLRHLKIPNKFIELCLYVAATKTNRIITAYGLTEAYNPRCGLDQGGVESPLLWRIVYEVLLAQVWQSNLGYPMVNRADLRAFHKIPTFEFMHPDTPLKIACLAFMDDTQWIAPSKANLQEITNRAMSFFALHGIEINPKKSELIVVNSTCADPSIRLGADTVTALPPATAARVLGVWFSADGKGAHTRQLVKEEVSKMCQILSRKAVTDKQCIYIFNNVLLPRILYRLAVTILSPREIKTIVGQYSSVVRQKVGLPHGSPTSILFHRRLYGLRDLGDALTEEQVSTAHLRLNDHDLLGMVLANRAMAHQAECRLTVSPFLIPAIGAQFSRYNLLGHVCRLMVERGITFQPPGIPVNITRFIGFVLPPDVYPKIAHQLLLDGVVTLDDVLTDDGQSLASWQDLRARHKLKGPVHRWFKELVKVVSLPPTAATTAAVVIEIDDGKATTAAASVPSPVEEDSLVATSSPLLQYEDDDSSEDEKLINRALERRRGQQREAAIISLAHVPADDRVTAAPTPDRGEAADSLQ
ncbi:hypothetical protein BG015_005876, partial [Linnemannia schmuckeri]